jgi:enamine deaminase RidA (YjgF/YER057c/UK114 family)
MKKLAATILFLWLLNCAQAQKLEWTNPDGLGKNPAFSQVVRAGKLLFIAGQTGVTADRKVVGPGMKQQYEQALNNLVTALKSQGTDLAHVAKMTTYVTAMDEFRTLEMVDLRVKRFSSHPPASTLVQVVRLADPSYKVEVEVIAVLP